MGRSIIESDRVEKAFWGAQVPLTGDFPLSSGIRSSRYFECANFRSYPTHKATIVAALAELMHTIKGVETIADIPQGVSPLVSSLADRLGIPQITPRLDQIAQDGLIKIDGIYEEGQSVVPIDDALTTGRSMGKAIEAMRRRGLVIKEGVILVDRQEADGKKYLEEEIGVKIHVLRTADQIYSYQR